MASHDHDECPPFQVGQLVILLGVKGPPKTVMSAIPNVDHELKTLGKTQTFDSFTKHYSSQIMSFTCVTTKVNSLRSISTTSASSYPQRVESLAAQLLHRLHRTGG